MSFLEKLKRDKVNRESYEREQLKLKQLILDINTTHNVVGEEFLDKLHNFIKTYNENLYGKR